MCFEAFIVYFIPLHWLAWLLLSSLPSLYFRFCCSFFSCGKCKIQWMKRTKYMQRNGLFEVVELILLFMPNFHMHWQQPIRYDWSWKIQIMFFVHCTNGRKESKSEFLRTARCNFFVSHFAFIFSILCFPLPLFVSLSFLFFYSTSFGQFLYSFVPILVEWNDNTIKYMNTGDCLGITHTDTDNDTSDTKRDQRNERIR